ncbi:predicted protein [Nematostella vectensis]|uniref:Uncharacterized protein n=1 Tax=Nematostella vectensis TaxID=45351 RepID=A7SYZ5_NEMVE|nr:predicted protein [Nematostella vectensis]|eukprot:XP_001623173.1 predicted protein [Nematostella vectensis]
MKLAFVFALVILVIFIACCDSKSTKKPSKSSKKSEIAKSEKHKSAKSHDKKDKSPKRHEEKHVKKSSIPTKKVVAVVKKAKSNTKKDSAHKPVISKSPKPKAMSKTKSKHKIAKKGKSGKAKDKAAKSEKSPKLSSSPANNVKQSSADMLKIPSDCSKLVQQYTNGEMVMFEYKAKMAKCLKHKDGEEIRATLNNLRYLNKARLLLHRVHLSLPTSKWTSGSRYRKVRIVWRGAMSQLRNSISSNNPPKTATAAVTCQWHNNFSPRQTSGNKLQTSNNSQWLKKTRHPNHPAMILLHSS